MTGGPRAVLEALAYRLFGQRVTADRHAIDRERYRALAPDRPFESFVLGVYGLAWVLAVPAGVLTGWGVAGLLEVWSDALEIPGGAVGRLLLAVAVGIGATLLVRGAVLRLCSRLLGYLVERRRHRVEATLPGAVRALHVAATGTTSLEQLFQHVARRPRVHGATADRLAAICEHHALTGNLEAAVRRHARETPAGDTLAPFLRSLLQRRQQPEHSLESFLARESRLLAAEDQRRHRRGHATLRRSLGVVLLLLVGPAAVGLALLLGAVSSPLPGAMLTQSLPSLTTVLATAGSGAVLFFGGVAAVFAWLLRPRGHRWAVPAPSKRPRRLLRTSLRNPSNAALLLLPVGLAVLSGGLLLGFPARSVLAWAYGVVALPVGLVDLRRSRRRASMDRALPSFVNDLADRLDGGLPLRTAVAEVASRETYGPLDRPVEGLAADLRMMNGPEGGRKRALERFVGRIGTPFAGRTVGLAVGAIDAGADARSAVTHLQTETGRLAHATRVRQSRLPVVLLVGSAVGLLLVAIVALVNLMVLESAAPAGPVAGVAVEALGRSRTERPLFYAVIQATMVASGWFAGLTGRGVYEALLHSGLLVLIAWAGFRFAGLI
jgi:Flp pilus assembly protein TadB